MLDPTSIRNHLGILCLKTPLRSFPNCLGCSVPTRKLGLHKGRAPAPSLQGTKEPDVPNKLLRARFPPGKAGNHFGTHQHFHLCSSSARGQRTGRRMPGGVGTAVPQLKSAKKTPRQGSGTSSVCYEADNSQHPKSLR